MHRHDNAWMRGLCLAAIAVGLSLAWRLHRGAETLRENGRLASENLAALRAASLSQSAATADLAAGLARRLEALAALRRKAAPNHERMLRMLRMLAADRRSLGPSDPAKVSMAYGSAALGYRSELLLNDAYSRAYRTIESYSLGASFAPLLARLAAEHVDTSRLMDLTLEWRLSSSEARALATQEGLGGRLATEASDAAEAAGKREIVEYLGSDNFAEYRAYLGGEFTAGQFQERLSNSGTPMTNEQYEHFAALVGAGGEINLLEATIPDDAFLSAAAFLTPGQIEVLRAFDRENRGAD